jgi:hemerythrin-like domain-containing protein
MTSSLPRVSHEHHERLVRHVDAMPAVADLIGAVGAAELAPRVDELCAFLTDLLIPHMEAAERALYPELERMLQNRHSMTPMRREHAEIREIVADLDRRRTGIDEGRLTVAEAVALRRVIFRLYALLKVHLAEERLYSDIVHHGVSDEVGETLAGALEHAGITAL